MTLSGWFNMINGRISLQGANYQLLEAEGKKVVDGRQTDESVPMKILAVKDHNSNLEIHLPFTAGEFEAFIAAMSAGRTDSSLGEQNGISNIIRPGVTTPAIFRNGG